MPFLVRWAQNGSDFLYNLMENLPGTVEATTATKRGQLFVNGHGSEMGSPASLFI